MWKKCTFIKGSFCNYFLNMKETLSIVMPEYDLSFLKYKELTSHISLDLIKELDIESDHYKNLIEELKIKIFPNK